MNKKLMMIGIFAVFMLVAISFSTAVSSNTMSDENKESPLFRIRTRKAIGERLDELKKTMKTKFIGERIFYLPFKLFRDGIYQRQPFSILSSPVQCTCYETCGIFCK